MEKFFGQEWKALGLYNAIRLSIVDIAMDKELLIAALSLWCLATNTMILSFSPLNPTSSTSLLSSALPPLASQKRPRQEADTTGEAPRPQKRVKKLAKKIEREIQVISSETTGVTAPSVPPSTPVVQASTKQRPTLASQAVQIRLVPGVAAEPPVVPLVEEPAAMPMLEEVAHSIEKDLPKNPKQSTVIMEELRLLLVTLPPLHSTVLSSSLLQDDESDEIPLASRPRLAKLPSTNPPPPPPPRVVEVTDQVDSPAVDRGKKPHVEPEATAKTPVHPQDQDLGIPPSQEVTDEQIL
ncbi:uncharacterized protein [Pyrus communis]|uniref:uncharacterized protein n=1 Tax=Pyrus communis TaxID=23211 RepID=UPI0035C0AB1C